VLDNAKDEKIEVATISFAHRNGEMIKKLFKRGKAFGNGRFSRVAMLDAEIEMLKRTKGSELATVVNAFITFATQEGYERCEKFLF